MSLPAAFRDRLRLPVIGSPLFIVVYAGAGGHAGSGKSKMNFGSGGNMEKKAWRDIWSGGQGVGNIHDVIPAGEVVARMAEEYAAAKRRLATV